ncbi:Superfamily I DNA and RNA helicases and helicase subunits-like [Calothrix sp. PCC 7716]|nr:Superfamily I DNA and RNA helicases and helicase subunits-like [Calothrix sp. PCC 7716]
MNAASKVDAILNAWLDYVDLDDFSNARIEAGKQDIVKQDGVNIIGNNILIDQAVFLELQQKVTKAQQKQETVWSLSFPQVQDVDQERSYFCPLFSLDITPILRGEYKGQGWNIDELKLTEAGENVATFLGLDDEQRELLITQDGLRRFLETTFELQFGTYEEWMRQVAVHRRYKIQRQPYLFEFTGAIYSRNLKQDLKEIKSGSKNWSKGHPAYEYLFGTPQPPKHEVTYMGAFPTHAPTNSQLTAIKHAQSEPITAVQGPPGSGKTTLILHLIAQQVAQRALRAIEKDEGGNNLIVISSTNNKAVDNVIEKLDKWLADKSLKHDFLYLKGGSKANIQSSGGATEKIQKAVDYLQKNSFDGAIYDNLKQQIKKIKDSLVTEESNYLEQRQQRSLSEERQSQLLQQTQTLQDNLEEALSTKTQYELRSTELAEYEQLPIEAYRKINLRFDNVERQLPRERLPWWNRLLRWLTGRTEENLITKAAIDCESAIESTFNTPFRVENPKNRSDLIQQARLVRERLEKAEELLSIQARLQKNSGDISTIEQKKDDALRELATLESLLNKSLKDFYLSFHQDFHDKHQELFKLSRELLTQQALYSKDRVKSSLELYSSAISGNWKDRNKMKENLDEHIKNLTLIFPAITSTLLSIRNMLPWVSECVDRTIIDEAGMIDLHKTFPLLVRSRKAIIVGDPQQIEPVITLSDRRRQNYRQISFIDKGLTENDYHRYSPEEEYSATTYHRAAGATGEDNDKGQGIGLIQHYRCQPSIIQYCNTIANYGLEVKTEPVESLLKSHLIAYHVEGNIYNNVNEEEITSVCEIVQHLLTQGYSLDDIGVISPFNAHATALRERLTQKFSGFPYKSIGTIHTFQGSEKKVIILSTKVCRAQDSVSWINRRPNLLNVAVSRAKELFILVGNLYKLEKGRLTRELVEHIREHGDILEYKFESEIPPQQPGSTLVYDCDHFNLFQDALEQAEDELIIVTPWIRGKESIRFVDDVVSALERGVKVTVIYGYKGSEENDNNDSSTESELKKLFSEYSGSHLICLGKGIHIENLGTNEKILVCDTKFAILGSWSWLSHSYRPKCTKSKINSKVQIRRETSIQLSDLSSIQNVKARIYQLFS